MVQNQGFWTAERCTTPVIVVISLHDIGVILHPRAAFHMLCQYVYTQEYFSLCLGGVGVDHSEEAQRERAHSINVGMERGEM